MSIYPKQHLRFFFLLSITVLLVNDFLLKEMLHNTLTGKLSDFAGLFAFSHFVSMVSPRTAKLNYWLVAVFFIIWKSPLIEPFLAFAQHHGLGLNRVVDYTDYIALAILPVAYHYWHLKSTPLIESNYNFKPVVVAVACFSFIATTLPRQVGELDVKSNLQLRVEANKNDVVNRLGMTATANDSYLVVIRKNDIEISMSVGIIQTDEKTSTIRLLSIDEYEITGALFFGFDADDQEQVKAWNIKDYERMFLETISSKLYQ